MMLKRKYLIVKSIFKNLYKQVFGNLCYVEISRTEAKNVYLHRNPVYRISTHPSIDSLFLSAGDDGRVLMYDMRAPDSEGLHFSALSLPKLNVFYFVQIHLSLLTTQNHFMVSPLILQNLD